MNISDARHAFITGGASGIGLGIADALAARGLAVTIADINEESLAEVTATRRNSFHGIQLDTRDREGWQAAKREAEGAFGPVDILVNNAGISPNGKRFTEMDPESFDRLVAVNLTGIYNGVWTFAADMQARGRGHIVNTSSQAGLIADNPGIGAYAAAKFGVTALSETLRVELAEHGIGVTTLFPGFIQTNLRANTLRMGGEVNRYTDVVFTSSVTPAHVGPMVIDAIERDLPYVMTHPGTWERMERRLEGLREGAALRDAAADA